MGLPHLEHARIPISARLYNGVRSVVGMMLAFNQGGSAVLSVTGNCRQGAVMEISMLSQALEVVVTIAHIRNIFGMNVRSRGLNASGGRMPILAADAAATL